MNSRSASKRRARPRSNWVPDRQDIIWIDCNPQAGREMQDIHPFVVLSPRIFNEKMALVIGLPMTTAEYNVDNPFAVVAGVASGRKTGKISYVLIHQPKSFDWRLHGAKAHPMKRLGDAPFAQVLARLNKILLLA